jgi:Arc/MetJ-type ribon-helix-helix transcriptional regulator
MTYQFPADVEKLVKEQMAASGYHSEDELLRDALRVLQELKSRQEELLADIRVGVDQADQGLARPLDVKALIDRCTLKLAEEGIRD